MPSSVTMRILKPSDDLVSCAEMLTRSLETDDPSVVHAELTREPISAVKLAGLVMGPGYELHAAEYSLTPVAMARLHSKPGQSAGAPAWYREPQVFAFDLFVVEPGMREMGIGKALLAALEHRTLQLGAKELSCDVPENAQKTIESLNALGYRRVDRMQSGPDTRLVLSRTIDPAQLRAA